MRDPDAKKVADMIELIVRDRVRQTSRFTLTRDLEQVVVVINGKTFSIVVREEP